jgi:hypothetical protein
VIIGGVLTTWSKKQILLGGISDWKAAMKKVKIDKRLRGINLWIDSVVFPRIGKRKVSRKSPKWS